MFYTNVVLYYPPRGIWDVTFRDPSGAFENRAFAIDVRRGRDDVFIPRTNAEFVYTNGHPGVNLCTYIIVYVVSGV